MRGYGVETRQLRIDLEIRKENGNGWDTSSEGTEEADPRGTQRRTSKKVAAAVGRTWKQLRDLTRDQN